MTNTSDHISSPRMSYSPPPGAPGFSGSEHADDSPQTNTANTSEPATTISGPSAVPSPDNAVSLTRQVQTALSSDSDKDDLNRYSREYNERKNMRLSVFWSMLILSTSALVLGGGVVFKYALTLMKKDMNGKSQYVHVAASVTRHHSHHYRTDSGLHAS